MKRVAWTLIFVLAGCGVALAAQDAASEQPAFDFHKLWQGAVAGLMASIIRFWSKGKKPTEFDWRYLVLYAGAGLLAGAYAAWRGLGWNDVFSWVEASGLVMVVYMALKGGKINLGPLVRALFGKKGGGDTSSGEGDGGDAKGSESS